MKKVEIISENKGYIAANVGSFDQLNGYTMKHPIFGTEMSGKLFMSEVLKTTGAEISFEEMKPKTEKGFWHAHNENEEVYVILKGEGEFLIDDDIIPLQEGSVIRIAPSSKRTWRNNSDSPLILMVIQVKEGSLNKFGISDGLRV